MGLLEVQTLYDTCTSLCQRTQRSALFQLNLLLLRLVKAFHGDGKRRAWTLRHTAPSRVSSPRSTIDPSWTGVRKVRAKFWYFLGVQYDNAVLHYSLDAPDGAGHAGD